MDSDCFGPMPLRLLTITKAGGELLPTWFSDRDRPWLRELLSEAEAFDGRSVAELTRRWRRGVPDPRAGCRLRPARHVVLRALCAGRRRAGCGAIRREVFGAAAAGLGARADVLAAVAARHGIGAAALEARLFSDLPHARRICWPETPLEPARLILGLNRSIAQAVLRRADVAELQLVGASRAVLRTAWLQGSWFEAARSVDGGTLLRWRRAPGGSGVARGLAAVVPVLPWARRFVLRARCQIRAEVGVFVLTVHDPILPGPEPRAFDSALERRFARDLLTATEDWDLLREPAPVVDAGGMSFPDFLLRSRVTDACWLVEIAGLRDRGALPDKLRMLDAVPRLLLCVPRASVPAGYRGHPRIIPFGRSVDAAEVLRRLSALEAGGGGPPARKS